MQPHIMSLVLKIRSTFKSVVFISTCFAFLISHTNIYANSLKQGSSGITQIKRIEPKFPISAAKKKQEGSVNLSFIVDEEGIPTNIEVLDSFGGKEFNSAAIQALKKWRYTLNSNIDTAQVSNPLTVRLNFMLDGNKGLNQKIKSAFQKINQHLKNNKLVEAQEELNKISEKKLRSLTERNFYHQLWASYSHKSGQTKKQLEHLNKMILDKNLVKPMVKFSILKEQLITNLALNDVQSAIKNYHQISKIKEAQPYLATFEKVIKQAQDKS